MFNSSLKINRKEKIIKKNYIFLKLFLTILKILIKIFLYFIFYSFMESKHIKVIFLIFFLMLFNPQTLSISINIKNQINFNNV